MKRNLAYIFLAVFCSISFVATAQSSLTALSGQQLNVPTSSVPFLNFTPDARSGALGEAGVALGDADANSVFWNPAKLIFAKQNSGGAISYTPWLRNLIGDMYYTNLSAFGKVGKNTAIAGSLLYFDLGTVDFTTNTGVAAGTFNSREYAITGSISQRLSQNLALALNVKYLNSNLAAGSSIQGLKPGGTAAADIALYYHNETRDRSTGQGLGWGWGAMISNLGGRINYGGNERYFIPTNLRLGTGLTYYVDQYNKFNFVLDFNKLMVPTPNVVNGVNQNGNKDYFSSVFGSFADAPGGFSEELKEVTISTGVEYWYNDQFAARVGYFNESNDKGGRKYFTTGIGLRLQDRFGVDFSYLLPVKQGNPLSQTFRISLLLNFNKSNRLSDDDVTDDSN
ncbi:type IX secretion system outer membrane channel protein PorV [Spirosoma sp. KNUC1025]|uniref:type IX secretion system outer membrane channel protein PorV n=1 Tax=Spirosoma sp. KNUC1025 TaxID=2894082 RepID=UPI003863B28D|nr:type IX secretion system outer membrane channel protein PorV [Spirosoma sp. KNUC1025]